MPTVENDGRGGGSGTYPGNSSWTTGSGATGTWQTWAGRKGDVARAILYLDLRYEGGTHGVTGHSEPDLRVTDDDGLIAASATGSNEGVAYMGMRSVLLQWHAEDPVDHREIHRNEVVHGYQGNRNPFIDHPEWVDCVFKGHCGGGGPTSLHVAELDGAPQQDKGGWRAVVTATAHHDDHTLGAGVTVVGTWSNGASGSGSCTTEANGQCDITSPKVKGRVASLTFTVSSLGHSFLPYVAGDNHDPEADSDGTVIVVPKEQQGDTAPTASISSPAGGSTVSGVVIVQVNAADVEDAAGSLAVQVSIDGGAYQAAAYNASSGHYELIWDTNGVSDGAHTVDARATDSGANTTNASQVGVTVNNGAPPQGMHVGDLDGAGQPAKGGSWRSVVTVSAHSDAHAPLANVTVTGQWSGGVSGGASCTTNGSGQCTLSSPKSKKASTITLSVTGMTGASYLYDGGANHDPDGDSDGTTITVNRP